MNTMPAAATPSTATIAACLAAAPLLLAATDLRSGVTLGAAITIMLLALRIVLAMTRDAPPNAGLQILWSSVVAAAASWLLAAWLPLPVTVLALLPLAAASPLVRQTHAAAAALRPGIVFALAPVIVGSAREAVVLAYLPSDAPLTALARWLTSPLGLLFVAALAVALGNALFRRTTEDPPAP